ncbi:uncharacterized protein G2W53_039359 [Senna tora]|uniref:Uncharacterized protein n=1 Tax=Senna tora TaxID=362788 RepID=A0A834W3G7_9FABA|nr:uncharacterized protein G2W53_039359 [Senna tora]
MADAIGATGTVQTGNQRKTKSAPEL